MLRRSAITPSLPGLFRAERPRAPPRPPTPLDAMPRVVLIPGVGLLGLGKSRKDAGRRRRPRRGDGPHRHRRRGRRPLWRAVSRPTCSVRILAAGTGQARPGGRETAAGQVAAITGGAGTIGAATARLFAAATARRSRFSTSTARRPRPMPPIGGAALGRCLRRHRCGVGRRGLRPHRGPLRRARHPRLQCRRGLAGADRRGRRRLLRQSFELNFFGHQRSRRPRCASCWRKGPAARCCSTPPSRRSIPARISAPTACPRRPRCSCRANMRSTMARTAFAPTPSTPTASAPAS